MISSKITIQLALNCVTTRRISWHLPCWQDCVNLTNLTKYILQKIIPWHLPCWLRLMSILHEIYQLGTKHILKMSLTKINKRKVMFFTILFKIFMPQDFLMNNQKHGDYRTDCFQSMLVPKNVILKFFI